MTAIVDKNTGFIDTYVSDLLTWVTGSTFPAVPAGTFLGLYTVLPDSTGANGTEVSPATRPGITLGSVAQDSSGYSYITHASAVSNIATTNTTAAVIVGFGIFAANSGGTVIYVGQLPYPILVGGSPSITIPAGACRVYARYII